MTDEPAGVLPAPVVDRLAEAVRERYGSTQLVDVLGPAGTAALSRSDLSAVDRLSRGGSPTETLIRLFLLGLPVSADCAQAALAPLAVPDALEAGLLEAAWGLEVDEAVAAVLAGCLNPVPLRLVLELAAAALDIGVDALGDALLPVVRDLVERGFLLPVGG